MKRFFFLLIFFFAAGVITAQPLLELRLLKPNVPAYYYYQLYFTAHCGDSLIYDLQRWQLILEEEAGRIDTNAYQIDRLASPDRNSCYEIALAFDNSSTVGTDLPFLLDAARAFIDTMTKSCDHASLISFNDRPTLHTFLANDRSELREAVEEMNISGRRALYDGISAGVTTLYTAGVQRVQAVLAFTSGNDNNSGRSLQQLLEDVRQYGIRVFIVALGDNINETPLRTLCRESGGVFYRLDHPDQLLPLYRDFAGYMQREFDEHRIIRRTQNVMMNNLHIRLRLEACNDSIWVERVFNPSHVNSIALPDVLVPIELGEQYPNPVRRSSTLHLTFSLHEARHVRLDLFDVLGRHVAGVIDERLPPGKHLATFSPAALRPGMYFYRLGSGSSVLGGSVHVLD